MTNLSQPPSGEPRRPHGPRDPGDAWVDGERGKFWGRFGAAGVLVHDADRGILLQHRATWSDQGGTWGLPGGALHQGEDAVTGALREAGEEAAVPPSQVRILFTSVFDVGYWSYTTVAARVTQPFEPVISDPESIELQWVPLDEVGQKPLHSGFAAAWPALREALSKKVVLVVDGANVVGSRPDGWWRDRRGAAQKLIDGLSSAALRGLPDWNGAARIWPEIVVVTEGKANGAVDEQGRVQVLAADRDGDQTVVDAVQQLKRAGCTVHVVTADRGLRSRVEELGAEVAGPGWLLSRIEAE
ncbi:NUDIX domain-containing protein [Arthrobacter sp. H14]|uniref:NUDIX domain-containing protein n=1 Tax=Arthrobacter sp. H14 TaxID=1312959 RepID=UPI00047ACFB2|nr:NUDIX domain-containing protein [Arthrobacter sp. H14]